MQKCDPSPTFNKFIKNANNKGEDVSKAVAECTFKKWIMISDAKAILHEPSNELKLNQFHADRKCKR